MLVLQLVRHSSKRPLSAALRGAFLAATCLALAGHASAIVMVTYAANAGGTVVPMTTRSQPTGSLSLDGGDGSSQPSFDPDNPTVQSASFIVGASHGALRAASLTTLAGGQSYAAHASARGDASFADSILIDAPGLTGLAGTVQVAMALDGVMAESLPAHETSRDDAEAEASLELSAVSSLATPSSGVSFGARDVEDGYDVDELLLLDVPFLFGEAFEIRAELHTSASVQMPDFPGTTSAIAEYANTATWQGILEVRETAGGSLVTTYDLSSASLTDYSGPLEVPEPTMALLLLAAGVLLTSRRRA